MKMPGVCHPLSQTLINSGVNRDGVRRFWLALLRRDNATLDPVMDNPQADAISLTNLADRKRSGGKQRARDAMLESDPTYDADREGLAG